jgi:hypothetical protein
MVANKRPDSLEKISEVEKIILQNIKETKEAGCWCYYGWCKSCDIRKHPDVYFYEKV